MRCSIAEGQAVRAPQGQAHAVLAPEGEQLGAEDLAGLAAAVGNHMNPRGA